MQNEDDLYRETVERLMKSVSPSAAVLSDLQVFLKRECKGSVGNLNQFLKTLQQQDLPLIRFPCLLKMLRMISKVVLASSSPIASSLWSEYLINCTKIYFSFPIASQSTHHFHQIIHLLQKFPIQEPSDFSDMHQLVCFLTQKSQTSSEKFIKSLVQKISCEVLVDKKNGGKSIKMNTYFSEFVSLHFDQIYPQLERLLIRSESNIEVWAEFSSSVGTLSGLDKFLIPLIMRIKPFMFSYSNQCLQIVHAVASKLKDSQTLAEFVKLLADLLSTEHNMKKKIVYIKMLKTAMQAMQAVSKQAQDQFANQVLESLLLNAAKIGEEEECQVFLENLEIACSLINQIKPETVSLCKNFLKSQNKYHLLIIHLTLSQLCDRACIDKLPAAQELYAVCLKDLPANLKKIESQWQWMLPMINFLSNKDTSALSHLHSDLPLFKFSILGGSSLEKINALQLVQKLLKFWREDGEECPNYMYLCASALLEELPLQRKRFIQAIGPEESLNLIIKGVYTFLIYPYSAFAKNRNNQFQSLVSTVFQNLPKDPADLLKYQSLFTHFHRVLVVADWSHIPIEKIRKKLTLVIEARQLQLEQETAKYLKCSFYNSEPKGDDENEQTYLNEIRIFKKIAESLIKFSGSKFLQQMYGGLIDSKNYDYKNPVLIESLERTALESVNEMNKQYNLLLEEIVERGFHKVNGEKTAKIYNAHSLEIKMMSEIEVQKEKQTIFFHRMATAFQTTMLWLQKQVETNPNLLYSIWSTQFQPILKITEHNAYRLRVYSFIRRSFEISAKINRKSVESKLFFKYSEFMGEFFILRYSRITPSVKLMKTCEQYLKELLEISFEDANLHFPMIEDAKSQIVCFFVNQICFYLLENMEFDINLKRLALTFFKKFFQKRLHFLEGFANCQQLFSFCLKNLNILSTNENLKTVLFQLMIQVPLERHKELLNNILNYIGATKILVLTLIRDYHKYEYGEQLYEVDFEEFIILKILFLEDNPTIKELASYILEHRKEENTKSIFEFNFKRFIQHNSKETVEKLCIFLKEEIQHCQESYAVVFEKMFATMDQLEAEKFDEEGLEILPFFLELNTEIIKEESLPKIFELLVMKFTNNQNYNTLSKLSLEVGIKIIKFFAKIIPQKLLNILQSFINKSSGVSNIIFLGVLAPYLEGNKNLQIIEKRITQLFRSDNESEQRSISKCMPDLMSFFKKPDQIVETIFTSISSFEEKKQIGQSYLFVGLLKGIGYSSTYRYLERLISEEFKPKLKSEKISRIFLLNAFVENFGRFVEIKGGRILQILIALMADNDEVVRNQAKKVGQSVIVKLSSYAVKNILPHLLTGLENEQNWRVKTSYIWILGIMANCSARQLQTSLPIIVPSLSTCLTNAHPIIRDKASEALNLIGQTIKNPEISQCVDILIEALMNPFQKSEKAIEILLKTKFSHFVDPPSLSIIIPILDYCMRARNSELKAGSCQVIGSIVELIQNPYDLLPYLKIITTGLKVALCDPLMEIRSIAAMAIGRISAKIGIQDAEKYFKFVVEIIESANSNTTERQGAAQAYSEIICSHTLEYFEDSINKIFEKLNSMKHSEKEGYILVFLYVPTIRTQQFEAFIKEVNENIYPFVSDEEETIRNSAMQVEKVIINNYCLSHTDLLLDPLCEGIFESNWKKRNAALILIGELLNILKSHMYNTRSNEKSYAYYRGLMAVYILKDDELEMPRQTANQVWNTYIENTPKTIKTGLSELVKMWTRWTHCANGVVYKNIVAFSSKYGENYFFEILEHLSTYLKHPANQIGVFEVLSQFIKRLNQLFLAKEGYKATIREFFANNIFTIQEGVLQSLSKCLSLYVQKMHEEDFFEQLVYPTLERMNSLNESSQDYIANLHLLKHLLHTNSNKIMDRLISKVMETPLSEFKIEVITNNADRLANHLYLLFKVPATQILVEEIYILVGDASKESRLSLIVYCLNQVSLKLSVKHKNQFIGMINQHVGKITAKIVKQKCEEARVIRTLNIFLSILEFFLHSTLLSEADDLEALIGQLAPLVLIPNEELNRLVHKIFLLLISEVKDDKTGDYYKQLIVSLENNTEKGAIIWTNSDLVRDYITFLVKGLAYGTSDIMDEALQMLQFLISRTQKSLISKEVMRIIGPVIRIINYPIFLKQKLKALSFISHVCSQNFHVDFYLNQILSVCWRLLQEFRNNDDVVDTVSNTYTNLLVSLFNRSELIESLLSKFRHQGWESSGFVQSLYYLVKSILSQKIELAKIFYEKIYDEFNVFLLSSKNAPVKSTYYSSKIVAKVGYFMSKNTDKIDAQAKGIACSYEILLNYLHFCYCQKSILQKLDVISIFLRESSRQKVYYLLKSLKLCSKIEQNKKVYSQQDLKKLVPENLSGFDEIADMVDSFESERQAMEGNLEDEDKLKGQINE